MFISSSMIALGASAAFVGLVHSLAPGHWLPVVLMTKGRRWPVRTAISGALVAASGHIFVSVVLGVVAWVVEAQFLAKHEEGIERFSALALLVFGLIYSALAYRRHSRCRGHTHHGPNPNGKNAPFLFLFSLGLSPCVAVLPVFAAAAVQGAIHTLVSMVSFAIGVVTALVGATVVVSLGVMKLDHPIFEHFGDVITGLAVALMGLILFVVPI